MRAFKIVLKEEDDFIRQLILELFVEQAKLHRVLKYSIPDISWRRSLCLLRRNLRRLLIISPITIHNNSVACTILCRSEQEAGGLEWPKLRRSEQGYHYKKIILLGGVLYGNDLVSINKQVKAYTIPKSTVVV